MGSISPPPEPSSLNVAIVGAGIAGVTLALGLQSKGIHTTVYERGSSFREIGAGIGFTANAERSMKLLDPRIHAAFRRVTVQNGTDWFMWMDGESEEDPEREESNLIHKMYLGERGFEGCHRAEFLDELSKMMDKGTVLFRKNLEGIVEREGDGGVELTFADGSKVEADVVIGCDGIRSRVRQILLGVDNPRSYPSYTHKYAFRGLVPMTKARPVLGLEKTETRHMYLGPNGHALTFPVAGGNILNVVAFAQDDGEWQHGDKFTAPACRDDAVKAFAGFNSTVRSIIDLLPEKLDKWAVFDTFDSPPSTYHKGKVCIMGDAAHASAPHHGAGAGLAIEDGAVLAHLLSIADKSIQRGEKKRSAILQAALESYNTMRVERAQWLVSTSRFVGEMYQFRDPRVGKDLKLCAEEIDWRSHGIWDYDVDGALRDAERIFIEKL